MNRNPFSFGNPVSDPNKFYGREREIRQITDRLFSSAFESTSVVGERRIGKTSLLKYLANTEVAEKLGLIPEQYVMVYVDFQGRVNITPVRFWSRILREVARKLADEELATMAKELGRREEIDQFDLEDLFLEIEDRGLKLVLLMDEFEYVTKNEKFGLDFFAGLRALAIHFPLSLITATREPLVDLCHSEAIQGSPFFNIFASVILKPFKTEEARSFVEGAIAETAQTFSEEDFQKIQEVADGHPIFNQMMGYYLFEGYQMGLQGKALYEHACNNFSTQAQPHFAYQWTHSKEGEQISLLAILALSSDKKGFPTLEKLNKAYDQAGYLINNLLKRGLVMKHAEDQYSLFSPLFGEWLISEMSAQGSSDPTSDNVDDWLESRGGIDPTVWNKVGKTFPKLKKEYWSLIAEFAMNASAEVASSLILRLGGM